jgi:hypothetical protein
MSDFPEFDKYIDSAIEHLRLAKADPLHTMTYGHLADASNDIDNAMGEHDTLLTEEDELE